MRNIIPKKTWATFGWAFQTSSRSPTAVSPRGSTDQAHAPHLPHLPSRFSPFGQRGALDTIMVTSVPDTTCRHCLLRVIAGLQHDLGACWERRWELSSPAEARPLPHLGANEAPSPEASCLAPPAAAQATGVCNPEGWDSSCATWQTQTTEAWEVEGVG